MAYEANLKNVEAVLKEFYLPAFENQMGIKPSALLQKIKKRTLVDDKIVAAAPLGLSGGFGYGDEGYNTPQAGNVEYQKFVTNSKDMYVDIVITEKTVRLANSKAAIIPVLESEIQGAYKAAEWNVGRSLFGNGTGKLCTVSSANTTNHTLEVDDVSHLKEGLIIQLVYNNSGTMTVRDGVARIKSIARTKTASANTYTVTLDKNITGAAQNDIMTVQNSYNREITGLGAIFDDNIASLYGVTKASNPVIKPIVESAGNTIDDTTILKAIMKSDRDKGGNVDTIMCGNDAYLAYSDYLRSDNRRVEAMTRKLEGGFVAIEFLAGSRKIDVICDQFVPTNEMWGVDSNSLTLYQTGWRFCELQGGGVFNLMEGKSAYRGMLGNYGDLICSNPGACIRITDVA